MHKGFFNIFHNIDTTHIYGVSQLVVKRTGMIIQANKAIVGANAFAHESGIHQDGVLKCKETYEIMSPDLVGVPSNLLILGKHSGRNAFRTRLETLLKSNPSYDSKILENNEEFQKLFKNFKKLADSKKKGVTDQDLYALVDDFLNIKKCNEFYILKNIHVTSGTNTIPTATVQLIDLTGNVNESSSDITEENEELTGNVITDAHIGHGAVHAIFQAINRLVCVNSVLRTYELKAITEGSDAMGRVVVRISEQRDQKENSSGNVAILGEMKEKERLGNSTADVFRGEGADNDVLVASAKAYINAINKLMSAKNRQFQIQSPQ